MSAPSHHPCLADYDRQLVMELAQKLAAIIVKSLAPKPVETASALVAVLGFTLAQADASRTPGALARTLNAVELLLLKHIASADRMRARTRANGRAR